MFYVNDEGKIKISIEVEMDLDKGERLSYTDALISLKNKLNEGNFILNETHLICGNKSFMEGLDSIGIQTSRKPPETIEV